MKRLTTSQAAKAAGVHLETVRYYQRKGLIAEPPRNDAGYRAFPENVVAEIRWIKSAQDLGFSLSEIKILSSLGSRLESDDATEELYRLAQEKIREIDRKIMQLERLKGMLEEATRRSSDPESHVAGIECPVLQSILKGGKNIDGRKN